MFTVTSPESMDRLGRHIAEVLRAGDVLCLTGELGAGKTTLTRGMGAALSVRGSVTSPTFVIARTHTRSSGPALVHVDAYRLGTVGELDDVDIDWDNSITVVEWGAPMLGSLVDDWINIVIDRTVADADDVRTVRVEPHGVRAAEIATHIEGWSP
jgi:tRNA threonylcarbamoyl adenosine modification protein YjeE